MKAKLFIFAGILTLTNASCTDTLSDQIKPEQQTTIYANVDADGLNSRSAIDPMPYLGGHVGVLWSPGDALGVFGPSIRNAKFDCSATTPVGRAAFTGACTDPQYAYYPYDPVNDGKEATALSGSLPAIQTYDPSTGTLQGDYKVGSPRKDAENEFDFSHIFALLRFNVEATGTEIEGEKLISVEISLPAERKLAGDFTFSAVDGSYTFTGNTSNSVKVKWADTPALTDGRNVTAYISVAPDMHADDEITVAVRTEMHKVTFKRHIAYDFEPNSVYTFDLTLSEFAGDMVVEDAAAAPVLDSFEFTVAANPGKILDKKVVSAQSGATVTETTVTSEKLAIDGTAVTGMIPYLYDFALVPDFKVPDGITVTVGGVEQTSGVSEQNFAQPVIYTLTNSEGETADYTVSVANTGLPVVVVKQSSALTTGSWRNWFGDLSVRSKDSEWATDDQFTVYNADGSVNMATAVGGMRLRGNSTQNFPKKPFAIKFNQKQAVCGMASHKRWVLLANWLDCSMMRNNTAFAIAHAIEDAAAGGVIEPGLAWNPHGTSVELVIDGRHVGNYYLCEQIKIGGKRLNINDAYEDVVEDTGSATFESCGYLIECDDNYDENCRFITARRYLPFMLKDDVPADYLSRIQSKVNGIEANILDGKYAAAYTDLDINSVIDQWIVYELTMNNEYKHPKSVYMYMNGDAKLSAGPVWDFDYQTFPNDSRIASLNSTWGGDAAPSASAWMYSSSEPATSAQEKNESDKPYMWYPLLFKDPDFRAAVQARWAVIYPRLKNVEAEIAAYATRYAESWEVNNAMWPLVFRRSNVTGWAPAFSGDENFGSYAEVVDNLLAMYSARLDWMNSAITAGNFYTNGK